MKKKAYVTRHASIRGEQRMERGLTQYEVDSAFKSGKEYSDFEGELSEFLKSKSFGFGHYVAKAYDGMIYIFENKLGHRLITVYKIPEEFLPIDRFLIKDEDLEPKCIMLTDKRTQEVSYIGPNGVLTKDIVDAIEFRSQKKAIRYIENNNRLQCLSSEYDITMF